MNQPKKLNIDNPASKPRLLLRLQRIERQAVRFLALFVIIIAVYPQSISAAEPVTETGGTTTASVAEEILPVLLPKITVRKVWLTAYTSSPDETDDTPFITASGEPTRDGIAAANFLPFGTKFKVPEVFGDKIFTIEDRMNSRKVNFVDIWVQSKNIAYKIGIHETKIAILD